MKKEQLPQELEAIVQGFDASSPVATADKLRDLWLQFVPKSMAVIKAELREQQETIGIPVPILKTIGNALAKAARRHVDDFLPLARLLWDDYGREGRVVAAIPLGAMELVSPERVIPLLKEMCSRCVTWEDADRLAMDALEPVVRKAPDVWLSAMEPWLMDENKWVRRAGATVVGRLPMKRPEYASRALPMIEGVLLDREVDVKKAVSFAIRIVARGDVQAVHDFLERRIPPDDPAATWVLCDAIRSMAKTLLPEFKDLLPKYEAWASIPSLTTEQRRSVDSAVTTLKRAD